MKNSRRSTRALVRSEALRTMLHFHSGTRNSIDSRPEIEQFLSYQNAQFFLVSSCVRREPMQMTALSGSSLLLEIIVHFDGYMPQGLALRDAAAMKDSQLV